MFSSQNSQVSSDANYIEDVFSTYLYTGNGSATYNNQLIQNGLNLNADENLGRDFLIWTKARSSAENHRLYSPVAYTGLISNSTAASVTPTGWINSATNGYYLSTNASSFNLNTSNVTYASWTFRKQPKFFDVVTYTGNGTTQNIAHNLGSTPGCIIVKRTDSTGGWVVWQRSISTGTGYYLYLNLSDGQFTNGYNTWGNNSVSVDPTSTQFTIGLNSNLNTSGGTYVAYLFAHNAGGFGLTGTDNVISCGSFTTNGSGVGTVTLGYEPQWVLIKNATTGGAGYDWFLLDSMRGMTSPPTAGGAALRPNTSDAEATGQDYIQATSTGFVVNNNPSSTYIYIAIRRGPMRVPTSGTSVFQAITDTGGTIETSTATFPLDMQFNTLYSNSNATYNNQINDRLRGIGFAPSFTTTPHLTTASTAAETTSNSYLAFKGNGMDVTKDTGWGGTSAVFYNFRRAPGFFDEVCYTGNGSSNNAKTHNLGVAPELLIIKNRSSSASGDWYTFHTFTSSNFKKQLLDTTDAQTNYTYGSFLDAQPTSTTFTVNSGAGCNESGVTYVAYLFATCAGVSKVGSYTGNGSTQTIDCGFTGGARFVLIKRTDSTGDWYVYDTARGMTTLTDPYLLLNSTAAESATLGSVTTVSTGFAVDASILAAINTNGASYIFLAIA